MHSISYIIPIHEESIFLEECLKAILSQSGVDRTQILIIQNAYYEDLSRFLKLSPNIKIFHEPRRGASFARNCGLFHAKTDFIAFIDCDVILDSDWTIQNLKLLELSPSVACIQGKIIPSYLSKSFLDLYRIISVRTVTKSRFNYLENPHTLPSLNSAAILCRREALNVVNGFSTELKRLEDTDLTYKLLAQGYQLGVCKYAKAKVYNNHRSFYRYLKRSLHLGYQGHFLRKKWDLPTKKVMWAKIKYQNKLILIFHSINFFCHILGNACASLIVPFKQKEVSRPLVNMQSPRVDLTYRFNDFNYHLRPSCRLITFCDKVHILNLKESSVLVVKKDSFKKIQMGLKGLEVEFTSPKLLKFGFQISPEME